MSLTDNLLQIGKECDNMIYLNQPETAFTTLTTLQAKIAINYYFHRKRVDYSIAKISLRCIDEMIYDEYEILSGEETYLYYEDVTQVFGRSNELPRAGLDYPDSDTPYALERVLGSEYYEILKGNCLNQGIDLAAIDVVFKDYSSDMVSKYIAAFYPQYNEIRATAIKEYDKEHKYPVLHSYRLYNMFIVHQILHLLYQQDFNETETETGYKEDYYQPKRGIDCIDFSPIEQRSFANEYVNYSFWTHQPDAYQNEKEAKIFFHSAEYGIKTGLFTLEELAAAILAAKPDSGTQKQLFDALDMI